MTAAMRAALLVEPRRFEVRHVQVPEPGHDEALVRVSRCGIYATDMHIFNGSYAAEHLPFRPGHEFTGSIVALGGHVCHLGVGQKVVVNINVGCGHCYWCRKNEILNCPDMVQLGISRDGGFAEYVAVPARLVIPTPESVDNAVLALTEPVSCVVGAARRARATFAQSVVILGAGPISNLHLQMMRLIGAAPIIAADVSEKRAALARASGTDVVVTDPAVLTDSVSRATDGRSADLVIESVGSPALYRSAFELIRKDGHVTAFGLTEPCAKLELDILSTVLQENSIKGSVAEIGEDMYDALTLFVHDRIRTDAFTGRSFALEDIQAAFEGFADRPQDLKTQIVT